MILVDTSIWVAALRSKSRFRLEEELDFSDVVTCLPVIQEVLQGFREERAYRIARESLLALPCLDSPLPWSRFDEAATLYRRARAMGATIRSSIDCLISASALAADVEIVHRDRDYPQLARVCSLRQRKL